MARGFFEDILIKVANAINEHFTKGTILEVKHLRRVLNIPPSDRSKIIFLSRALQELSNMRYLDFVGKNSPKRYKKVKEIPIDALKTFLKKE